MISDTMAIPANLDAFLLREDFHAEGDRPAINEFQEMGLTELREQWVHHVGYTDPTCARRNRQSDSGTSNDIK